MVMVIMKKAIFIYNPNSGKKTKKKIKNIADFKKIESIFKKYNYEVRFIETEYAGHAKEIIKTLDKADLVVSLGGDGTFNEIVSGNMKRKDKLLVTHVPYGTTNDIGNMFGLGKNLYKNLELLLSGEERNLDLCFVNGEPFIYVAGFGKFLNIPYETDSKLKKKIGYPAYILGGIKDFFFNQTPLYEIEYKVDGEVYHGLYSLALISNATRIAGIKNFYKNVRLNDGKFEVLFCNLKTKQEIIKSLFYFRTNDITKVPGLYCHKTDYMKITFIDRLKKPWCIDGEKLNTNNKVIYEITTRKDLRMLVPKKILDKLFVEEGK